MNQRAAIATDSLPVIPKGVIVDLSFDPSTAEDERIKKIFSNRIARNIWLGIKWRHLTFQFFIDDCLRIAKRIEKKPPKTPAQLGSLFLQLGQDPNFRNYIGQGKELAQELFPYVTGDLDFQYRIKPRESFSQRRRRTWGDHDD